MPAYYDKQAREQRILEGFCDNHPAEALIVGMRYCARCQSNQKRNNRQYLDAGICGRCKKRPLKTATACQICLWELTEGGIFKKFGLTPEDYARMEYGQNQGCWICKQKCPSGKALAVDHDHKTGRIRGLLCITCNRMVGFIENYNALKAFNDYLAEPLS
jgi:Pyruvate/2-oxoacid:ferredoxin oxidoreductase delta subunit